ncbi:hypothetical protein [Lysobacter humi (ex Lee et al. 2017)]
MHRALTRGRSVVAWATLVLTMLVVLPAATVPADAAEPVAKTPHVYRYERHTDFRPFFEDFRHAVLTDDRQAVARMTAYPFRDFANVSPPAGTACDVPDDGCSAAEIHAKRTSRNAGEFLARYARIFGPGVREALRARLVRRSGHYGGDDYGPLQQGEVLLDAPEIDDQRVFARTGRDGRFRMVRIPFYP